MEELFDFADFAVKELEKKGAVYAEARLEISQGHSFVLKNGVPEVASFEKVQGLGVRFITEKRCLGFAGTNILQKKKIIELVNSSYNLTVKSAKICGGLLLSEEKVSKKKYKVAQKKKLSDIDPDEKLKILFDLEKSALSKKLPNRYFSYDDWVTQQYYINSEGTKIIAEIPRLNLFYLLTLAADGQTIQRYRQFGNVGGFEFVQKWDVEEKMLSEIDALYENLKNGKRVKGKFDVVVGSEITGIMVHESVGHPYEADRIMGREAAQAGESFVTIDMLGKKIGSSLVTVVDDPTLQNSYGFYLYDAEGVRARRKYLMKDGRINELLHNRETAAVLKIKSNGSARALNYSVEPIIRMSNTFVLPRDWSDDEMIEDTKRGIYIKSFMEWNIDDKRVNQKYTGNEAYLVEDGEIKTPIKRPVIEITTQALWSSIDAVGKKVEWHAAMCGKGEPIQGIPVLMGGPSMRLRNVYIK